MHTHTHTCRETHAYSDRESNEIKLLCMHYVCALLLKRKAPKFKNLSHYVSPSDLHVIRSVLRPYMLTFPENKRVNNRRESKWEEG